MPGPTARHEPQPRDALLSRLDQVQPLAVEGEVTAVSDGLVTLHVSHVFRGDPGTVVEVRRPTAAEGDYSAFEFTLGQDYLLAAGDTDPAEPALEIALCGLSGPTSPELRDVYDKAFR